MKKVKGEIITNKLKINYRIWIEISEEKDHDVSKRKGRRKKETSRFICGKGVYSLLKAIDELGSLTAAANKVGHSYKYAWDRTQKIKNRLGEAAVEAMKGGKGGGGAMKLSEVGKKILEMYEKWNEFFAKCIKNKEKIESSGMLEE
ncbi:MAG: winged helix-turn-helix domain-containing protein [Promethearchaeota archaeon]